MKTSDSELESELQRQASAIRVDPPRDLNRKISAAIASAAANPRPARGPFFQNWTWWAAAGGALAAAFVGLTLTRGPAASPDTHADAAALAREIQGMPQRVLASLQPQAAVPPEDPLRQEAKALTTSAQSALGFLAYNFLPTTNG